MKTTLDETNPDDETIRRWAYDNDMFFIEQDEDSILYGEYYFPLLIDICTDRECPKRDYILSIISNFLAWEAKGGMEVTKSLCEKLAVEIHKAKNEELNVWFENVRSCAFRIAAINKKLVVSILVPDGKLAFDKLRKIKTYIPKFEGMSLVQIAHELRICKKIEIGVTNPAGLQLYNELADSVGCKLEIFEIESQI